MRQVRWREPRGRLNLPRSRRFARGSSRTLTSRHGNSTAMPSTPDRFHRQQLPEPAMARKPEWLKVKLPQGEGYERVRAILKRTGLATVCQQARCPNMGECWGGGTATVMLMGEICTRGCRFCHVRVGHPKPLDSEEPEHLGRAARELQLKYLVVTSVDRDDLPDGGASHFARAIAALR